MLAEQRQREILTRVAEAGSVRVSQLSDLLGVAEETIRRDLEKLHTQGKLIRTHGGALAPERGETELPFAIRKTANVREKRAIAARAVACIVDGDVLALDASSTACELARIIPDIPLTVITNSIVVATMLASRQSIRVIATGGLLDAPSLSYVGSLAEDALGRFHINRAFLSAKGVDLSRGLSVAADEQARVKRRMMELADASYLLVDHTKFGLKSVVLFSPLTDIDVLITDTAVDRDVLAALGEMNVTTETAA